MMKFGALGAIGTVVAIQAGDYHQNVDNVRNELGNMFNHLVHEVDHSTHKVDHLKHVEEKFERNFLVNREMRDEILV